MHVANRPQEMPQLLKARAVRDHLCRDRGRLGVTFLLLASPAGPPHPHLEPGARAVRQEVRGACRKPQEELRLQPAPPPPAWPWGPWGHLTLHQENLARNRLGGGRLLPWVPIPVSSFPSLSWILLTAERDQLGREIFESR